METDFKLVPIADLHPSPTNPRKFFDKDKTHELALSINEKGVLQPILVRPRGNKFEIISGERRYRASKLVIDSQHVNGVIPAVIRAMGDQEVREIQLIENFQREDVHPMEEAVAIKSAVDSGKYSYEDIAAKVGKPLKYIRQRMKLNDLTHDWQKVFFRNGINIGSAMKLAAIPPAHQKEIFKSDVRKDDGHTHYNIDDYTIDQYKGDLHHAAFDLTDPSLNPVMGACTGCQFNSAVNQLFPELERKPRCTNIICFKKKTDENFKRELHNAKEEPGIILMYDSNNKTPLIDELRKEGYEVLKEGYNDDVRIVKAPEQPNLQEIMEEDPDLTQKEAKLVLERETEQFKRDSDAFQKQINTGKLKKAFMVLNSGYDTGKYFYVELQRKAIKKEAKKAIEAGAGTTGDIAAEIERLKASELRAREIDENNIWLQLKPHFNPSKNSMEHAGQLDQTEMEMVAVSVYNHIAYTDRNAFEKLFQQSRHTLDFSAIDLPTFWKVLRFFFLSTLPPHVLNSGFSAYEEGKKATLCLKVAQSYFPAVLADIKAASNEKALKRQERNKKKISDLEAQKNLIDAEKSSQKKQPKNVS